MEHKNTPTAILQTTYNVMCAKSTVESRENTAVGGTILTKSDDVVNLSGLCGIRLHSSNVTSQPDFLLFLCKMQAVKVALEMLELKAKQNNNKSYVA